MEKSLSRCHGVPTTFSSKFSSLTGFTHDGGSLDLSNLSAWEHICLLMQS